MLGPDDLSVFLGLPGQFEHGRIRVAKRRVAHVAKAAGKQFGWPDWVSGNVSPPQRDGEAPAEPPNG